MKLKYLATTMLAAAFAAGSFPGIGLSTTTAAAAGQECGWATVNGTLVFLGTCADEDGAGSEQTGSPWRNPCGARLTGGPVYSYRMIVTGC